MANETAHAKLLIGVTGRMHLDEMPADRQAPLRSAVNDVLRRLLMTEPLSIERGACVDCVPSTDIDPTQAALVTGLAPGADTLVLEVACGEESSIRMDAMGALPFPPDVYRDTSTFVWSRPRLADKTTLEENNTRRQSKLSDCVSVLSDCFWVPLAADDAKSAEELDQQLRRHRVAGADALSESERSRLRRERYLRYRASGEYIATHSHVMLAILPRSCDSDTPDTATESLHVDPLLGNDKLLNPPIFLPAMTQHEDDDLAPGTEAIISVRRNGLTPGLLRDDTAFVWTTLGPLIVIEYPPEWEDPDETVVSAPGPDDVTVRVEWPQDAPRDSRLGTEDAAAHTSTVARQQFLQMTNDLSAFHRDSGTQPPPKDDDKERLQKQLLNADPQPEAVTGILEESVIHKLAQLATARRSVADIARRHSRTHQSLLLSLFLVTVAAAISLHLASHWHAQGEPKHNSEEEQRDAHASIKDSHYILTTTVVDSGGSVGVDDHSKNGLLDPRTWFRGLALGLAFAAFCMLKSYQSRGDEKRRFDYRAMAEALRIQCYWLMAGITRSVPGSYMQRQRGEMDWFRQAVSSMTAPYHRWKACFDDLPQRARLRVLQAVAKCWIAEQHSYCQSSFYNRAVRLAAHHVRGNTLASVGVLIAIVEFWGLMDETTVNGLAHSPGWRLGSGVVLALCVLPWLVLLIIGSRWASTNTHPTQPHWHRDEALHTDGGHNHDEHDHHVAPRPWLPESDRNKPRKCLAEGWAWVWLWLEYAGNAVFRKLRSVLAYKPQNYLPLLGPGVPIFFGSLALGILLAGLGSWSPPVVTWWTWAVGINLLSGAMSIAYAEKSLLSEEAMQYNAMAAMHRAALRRIAGHLKQAEQLLADESMADELRSARVDAHIAAVQSLLEEAGLQCLDENAEWLILHRSRPMEPVMAG